MKNSFLIFSSVTVALKAQKFLEQRGIYCDITKTPRIVNGCGCGHSLRIRQSDLKKATELLQVQRIPLVGTYGGEETA